MADPPPGFERVTEPPPGFERVEGPPPGFERVEEGPGFISRAAGFAGEAVTDLPRAIVSGAREAGQQILEVGRGVERKIPIGGFRFDGGKVRYVGPEEFARRPELDVQLPEVAPPETLPGQIEAGVTQFIVGFGPAFKAAKLLGFGKKGGKIAKLAEAEIAAIAGEQLVFDPNDPRLSDLIQQFPVLQNPVNEFLSADPADSEARNRLELALESAGIGVLVAPLVSVLSSVRRGAQPAATKNPPGPLPRTEPTPGGDPARPLRGLREKEVEIEAGLAGDRAGNINLENLNTTDEVKNALKVTAKEEGDFVEARRGVVDFDQTRQLADDLGMTPDELVKRHKGQAFNAEEALAARNLLVASGEDLTAKASRAVGGSDEELAEFRQAYLRHVAIQEQVAGFTAEAGRALNAFKIGAESDEALRAKLIKSMIESSGGRKNFEDLAEKMSRLETPEQVATFARQSFKAKTSDKLMEAWINALLSGPQTHAVNTLSNSLVALWTIPERYLAAGLSKVRGGDVTFREANARVFGLVEGISDGLVLASKTFLKEEPSDAFLKVEARRQKAIPGLTGKVIRIPTRLLTAEDEFFKSIGYRMELNALAVREGLAKGLKGRELAQFIQQMRQTPSDKIKYGAIEAGRYQTFTSELGEKGQLVQRLANSYPPFKLIAPFVRTPVNIVTFAGERTPLGLASRRIQKELIRTDEIGDIARARMAMGTGIATGIAALAAAGHITGGGPTDPALRSRLRDQGWQPYSIKIGDKYHAYGRLEPLGILFGLAADYNEIVGQIGEKDAVELATSIVISLSQNLTSKTFLRGVSGAFEAMGNPDRYGERFVQRFIGTAVPTGVAQVARIEDPILRDARTITDTLKARLPGYSDDLPARRNLWGEPIILEGGFGPDLISPVYSSTAKPDKVSQEMFDLEMPTRLPQRTIDRVELSPRLYSEFVERAGKPAKEVLDVIVNSPKWDGLPSGAKRDIIDQTITKFRSAARDLMIIEHPELFGAVLDRRLKEGLGR